MSRRCIAWLALAAATLIVTPGLADPRSGTRPPRHVTHQRDLGPIAGPITTYGLPPARRPETTVTVEPRVSSDPSWKLCQLDPGLGDRPELCGPHSYYPYGASGYQPFGTYRRDHVAPADVVAPDAFIMMLMMMDDY
jgi:hypothetical protein